MKKLLAILLAGVMVLSFAACGSKIEWPDSKIASAIPQPTSNKGEISSSSNTYLSVDVENVSLSDYNDYVQACIKKGFTIDSEETGSSYSAFHENGYEIRVTYSDSSEEMWISAEILEELGALDWPTTGLGSLVPAPNSNKGHISWNNSTDFIVHIGDLTKEEYNAYVKSCEDRGFNIDFSKEDDYYSAKNKNGYELTLRYLGLNRIEVSIDAPEGEEEKTSSVVSDTTEDSSEDEDGEDTGYDWQEFIDDYEAWVDDYIDFMAKYKANPTDLSLISDYAEMMTDMSEWSERANEIKDDLSTAEALKYSAELTRIAAKLAKAAY